MGKHDIYCGKCKGTIETNDPTKIKFCNFCGSLIPMSPREEQPFHLPELPIEAIRNARIQIVDINKLIENGGELPPALMDALKECSEILKKVSEGEVSCLPDWKEYNSGSWDRALKKLKNP